MILDFVPSTDFPSNTVTDGQFLYRSLGSFWTSMFSEKECLKGYTLGMAEELIQSYYNLVEVVRQFSVKEIDVLHKERWKALTIKKSEFNSVPIQAGDALVFGVQPSSDPLYANKIFRVGFPKEAANVYSFKPSFSVKKFGAIANRIISPSVLYLPGVDIIVKEDALIFNKNIFADPSIPKAKLITEEGTQATYTTSEGNTIDDEFVVLWIYNLEQDTNSLYSNFGVLFDIQMPSSQNYKELLKAVMNLSVDGPSIAALNQTFAALMNVPIIIEPTETVEDIYDLSPYTYVVTDKNVYRAPIDYMLHASVVRGAKLHVGDILTDNVRLFDTSIHPTWWITEIDANTLGFSNHVFAANVDRQLFFENTASLITYNYTTGRIIFPVKGDSADVQLFQDYVNLPENKTTILSALGLSTTQTSSTAVNPLDFVFRHIFKNNTLFVKLSFYSTEQLETFFSLLGDIRKYLPPHVYLLMYVNMERTVDELINLNSCVTVPAYGTAKFSADGSTSTGARPGVFDDDTKMYYKDYANRMFCVAKGPLRNAQPLYADGTSRYSNVDNLDTLSVNNTLTVQGAVGPGIKCGLLRTQIPLTVQPIGETVPRRPTNREIPTLLLIDF